MEVANRERSEERRTGMRDYVTKVLLPMPSMVRERAQAAAEKHASDHGRTVWEGADWKVLNETTDFWIREFFGDARRFHAAERLELAGRLRQDMEIRAFFATIEEEVHVDA